MDYQRLKKINERARERAARKRERDAKNEGFAAKKEEIAAWNLKTEDPIDESSKDNICIYLKVMPKREWRLKVIRYPLSFVGRF